MSHRKKFSVTLKNESSLVTLNGYAKQIRSPFLKQSNSIHFFPGRLFSSEVEKQICFLTFCSPYTGRLVTLYVAHLTFPEVSTLDCDSDAPATASTSNSNLNWACSSVNNRELV